MKWGKTVFTVALRLAVPTLLFVASADLIYLYFAGKWYDPIGFIQIAELVMFNSWCIIALVYLGLSIKHLM